MPQLAIDMDYGRLGDTPAPNVIVSAYRAGLDDLRARVCGKLLEPLLGGLG